jgi:hypothetical protein
MGSVIVAVGQQKEQLGADRDCVGITGRFVSGYANRADGLTPGLASWLLKLSMMTMAG